MLLKLTMTDADRNNICQPQLTVILLGDKYIKKKCLEERDFQIRKKVNQIVIIV